MALGKRSKIKDLGQVNKTVVPHDRFTASHLVSEGDITRRDFFRSRIDNSIEAIPLAREAKVSPGSENRSDMSAASLDGYGDYRMYWLFFWANRSSFESLNPLRATSSSVMVIPDRSLAVDMIEGRD